MNTYQPIPVEEIIARVTTIELGYLKEQARTVCETDEQFEGWMEEVYPDYERQFAQCETLQQFKSVLTEVFGVDNPSEYILDNYIIR